MDSTMLDIATTSTKEIYVGTHTSNKPLSSQLVLVDDKEKYLMLDNGWIFVFDWESGAVEDSIPVGEYGTLNNYSGFSFISSDSLLVYNYRRRDLTRGLST